MSIMKIRSRVDSKYHSALNSPARGIKGVNIFLIYDSVAFVWDIFNGKFPDKYSGCDIFYSELAWRVGFEIFNERAGIWDNRTFAQYMETVSRIIKEVQVPLVIIIGKHAERYLPRYDQAIHTTLNKFPCMAYIYNAQIECPQETTIDILKFIAAKYRMVGDFCCGYGRSGRVFAKHRKSFVMSDFNPKCIGYIARHAKEWFR